MPKAEKETNRAAHMTTGSVFDDLGLSPSEAVEAKIKADLWRDLMNHVATLGLTQKELAKRLGVHHPDVSNLHRGKLSRFGVDSLIRYAVKLGLSFEGHFTRPSAGKLARVKAVATPRTRPSKKSPVGV